MAIVYPLALPESPWPSSVIPRLTYTNSVARSRFTQRSQKYRWVGEIWSMDITLPKMTRDEAEEWIAFAMKLRGNWGSFLLTPSDAWVPRGIGGGAPVVDGAGQALDYYLEIKNAPPDTVGWLKVGDYFSVGDGELMRLYKLTRQADTDVDGKCILEFAPRLREAPADNAEIVTVNAQGAFEMISPVVEWDVQLGLEYGFNFQAIEAL